MKQLIVMVGPAGAGKSTMSRKFASEGFTYINQDAQGRQHLALFDEAIKKGENVIVDRMGFTKQQRDRYLDLAKKNEYHTRIIVLHQPYAVCLARCLDRKDHETIKEGSAARSALNMFFSKYERVQDNEADVVERHWPEGMKPKAIVCDLDGTLCKIDHRLHYVKKVPGEKKNWFMFFEEMDKDEVNEWCSGILKNRERDVSVVLCSGRPDNYSKKTVDWLTSKSIGFDDLFMRNRNDQRQDNIAKEIILDFEILTRYTPYFMIDDRQQVVDMWRSRGYTCLQCAPGNF